jgi:hypothetical protein
MLANRIANRRVQLSMSPDFWSEGAPPIELYMRQKKKAETWSRYWTKHGYSGDGGPATSATTLRKSAIGAEP